MSETCNIDNEKFYTAVIVQQENGTFLEFVHSAVENPVTDLDWQEGDTLKVKTLCDNSIILTKVDDEER